MKLSIFLFLIPVLSHAQTYDQNGKYTYTLAGFSHELSNVASGFKVKQTVTLKGHNDSFSVTSDEKAKFKCYLRVKVRSVPAVQSKQVLKLFQGQVLNFDPKDKPGNMSGISLNGDVNAITAFTGDPFISALVCSASAEEGTHQMFYKMTLQGLMKNIDQYLDIAKK